MEPKKRLFIAIGVPREVQTGLANIQQSLKPYARDAKWVNVAGIHLTLKFLGYVDPARIPTIIDALKAPGSRIEQMQIVVEGCGFFPNARRPNVLWAGVHSEKLGGLQTSIEEIAANLGFEKENRPFSPHLTLARFRDPRGLIPLSTEVEKRKDIQIASFTASDFSLYESILHREGAEYRTLHTFP